MKISIVFLLFLLFVHLNAHISIRMDDGDFTQVGDFLQTFAHGPIHPYEHSFFLRNLNKFTSAFIKMFGFMLTLLTANLLTVIFTPLISTSLQETKSDIFFGKNSTINNWDKNEFGCIDNVCWRSCYTDNDNENGFWCYSSPDINSHEYKSCNHESDCAPYWECLNPCQSGMKKVTI